MDVHMTSEPSLIDKKFFDKTAINNNLLLEFTSLLRRCHTTFNGFCAAYNDRILEQSHSSKKYGNKQPDGLDPKLFQNVWIEYQLARIPFMLTTLKQFKILQSCINKAARDHYFKVINQEFYKLFVSLWSNHKTLSTNKHCKDNCSSVFICDGHQKPCRLVCKQDMTDKDCIELGGVMVGCPETPQQKSQKKRQKEDGRYCYLHQPTKSQQPATDNGTMVDLRDTTIRKEICELLNLRTDNEYNGLCNVYRDCYIEHKQSSFGFIATFLNCGIIVGFTESVRAESVRRLLRHLLEILKYGSLPPNMMYDNACAVKLYTPGKNKFPSVF
ncbi:unnamed protein product [Didymodactylos carnosus]|uniref:Uncharacterized protein n=1 Tax=Didymodactylos carnosus TaxID=1234261 RepID=A0A815JSZ6_9BILA|nr:unnamed protein product [Didymodactylos carnosus]CAF4280694.1 unnamed protein product [Didymodactylos carnosus]